MGLGKIVPVPSLKSSSHRLLELAHAMFCNSTLSSVICISLLRLYDFLICYLSVPGIVYKNKPIKHLIFRTCGITFCLRFCVQLYLKFCTNAASSDNICPFPFPCPPPNLTFYWNNVAYNFTWITPDFFNSQFFYSQLYAMYERARFFYFSHFSGRVELIYKVKQR
jgi:hypothetical protein